jgi:hypothetical protein
MSGESFLASGKGSAGLSGAIQSPLEFARRREPWPVKNVSGNPERSQAKTYLMFQQ